MLTIEQVLFIYKQYKCIKQTAKIAGVSQVTVKKILIDKGLFSTKTSQKVQCLHKQGVSVEEIMKETGLSRSSVYNYLPYTKGIYNTDNPTKNALYMRKYRAKKK